MTTERQEFEALAKERGYDRDELARDPRGSESRKYLSWYVEMTWLNHMLEQCRSMQGD